MIDDTQDWIETTTKQRQNETKNIVSYENFVVRFQPSISSFNPSELTKFNFRIISQTSACLQ